MRTKKGRRNAIQLPPGPAIHPGSVLQIGCVLPRVLKLDLLCHPNYIFTLALDCRYISQSSHSESSFKGSWGMAKHCWWRDELENSSADPPQICTYGCGWGPGVREIFSCSYIYFF